MGDSTDHLKIEDDVPALMARVGQEVQCPTVQITPNIFHVVNMIYERQASSGDELFYHPSVFAGAVLTGIHAARLFSNRAWLADMRMMDGVLIIVSRPDAMLFSVASKSSAAEGRAEWIRQYESEPANPDVPPSQYARAVLAQGEVKTLQERSALLVALAFAGMEEDEVDFVRFNDRVRCVLCLIGNAEGGNVVQFQPLEDQESGPVSGVGHA